MLQFTRAFVVVAFVRLVFADNIPKCPDGGTILELGDSEQDTETVVDLINNYRKRVSKGLVPGQPRAVDLKTVSSDADLAQLARSYSLMCTTKDVLGKDKRWTQINIMVFASHSDHKTTKNIELNWALVLDAWYKHHKNFIYPRQYKSKYAEAYLQLVWANTTKVGCDNVLYQNPSYQYSRIHICYFGPGVIMGKAPYKTA